MMPSPTAWTLSGLVFSLLAALFFSKGGALFGAVAGLMVLVSGFFDIVDGSVARATGRASKRGAFLDSTLDRIGEVAMYFGILLGNYAPPVLVLLAITLSLLVSYARAKADSLNVSMAGVGIGERSERLVVLIVASLLGLVALGVLIVAVIAFVTFVQRTVTVSRALGRKPKASAGGP